MNRTIAQLRSEVNDKMVKKFGMKIDFDEMEEAVLTRLLQNQSNVSGDAKDKDREIQKLKVMCEREKNSKLHSCIFFWQFNLKV